MKNFRCYSLGLRFYSKVKNLRLPQHLSSQLKRASSSVVCNLREGAGRRTPNDQRRFFFMALGSIRECHGILEMAEISDLDLLDLCDHLSASLYKLCHYEK